MPTLLEELRSRRGAAPDGATAAPAAGSSPTQQPDVALDTVQANDAYKKDATAIAIGLPEFTWAQAPSVVDKLKKFGISVFNSEPEDIAKAMQNMGVEGYEVKRTPNGAPYVVVQGKPYSLNAKGVSPTDVTQFLSLGAAGAAATALTGGGIWPALGVGAALGGAEVAGKGLTQGEMPSAKEFALNTGVGAVFGLGGELVANAASSLIRRGIPLFSTPGTPSDQLRAALRQQGINADDIPSTAWTELQRRIGNARQVDPDVVRRTMAEIDADAVGGPRLTRGQATGNEGQLALETELREGVRGGGAAEAMRTADQTAMQGITDAGETIAGRVAPTSVSGLDETGLGVGVARATQGADQSARANVRQLYDQARTTATSANLAIPNGEWPALERAIQGRLAPFVDLDPATAPGTFATLRGLQNRLANTPTGFVDATMLEGFRKAINVALRSATAPTDRVALRALLEGYDDWVEQALMRHGGPSALQITSELRAARSAAADRFNRFTQRDSRDSAGRVIEDIVAGRLEPIQVADKILGAGNELGPDGIKLVRRLADAIGPRNPVMDDVRRAVVQRIIGGGANMQATLTRGPEGIANAIERALGGKGADYARQILGQRGIEDLRALQRIAQRMTTPKHLRNPSRSGYTLGRQLRSGMLRALGMRGGGAIGNAAMGGIGGSLGFLSGGFGADMGVGAIVGGAVLPRVGEAVSTLSARRAARGFSGPAGRAADLGGIKQAMKEGTVGLFGPASTAGGLTLFDLDEDE